ncbi:MAG TPA: hypothetical protein VF980_13070 [Thermoanaerobaculia bacterium]
MRLAPFALALALAVPAQAADLTDILLARAWPYAPYARLNDVGAGVAVVFSPDLSVPGNCRFYHALGFACFDDPDWSKVLQGLHDWNVANPDRPIRTVVLETHGTNGNGLKLQKSYDPKAPRSYISVGGLQERLDAEKLRYVLISACNSGRLLRPKIFRNLDPANGDKLFLPATLGIIGASDEWNEFNSQITIIAPASSHIEMTVVGSMKELAPATRQLINRAADKAGEPRPVNFAMSDLMMQMLTRDKRLRLQIAGGVDALSREKDSVSLTETLFARLVKRLNTMARNDAQQSFDTRASR